MYILTHPDTVDILRKAVPAVDAYEKVGNLSYALPTAWASFPIYVSTLANKYEATCCPSFFALAKYLVKCLGGPQEKGYEVYYSEHCSNCGFHADTCPVTPADTGVVHACSACNLRPLLCTSWVPQYTPEE